MSSPPEALLQVIDIMCGPSTINFSHLPGHATKSTSRLLERGASLTFIQHYIHLFFLTLHLFYNDTGKCNFNCCACLLFHGKQTKTDLKSYDYKLFKDGWSFAIVLLSLMFKLHNNAYSNFPNQHCMCLNGNTLIIFLPVCSRQV